MNIYDIAAQHTSVSGRGAVSGRSSFLGIGHRGQVVEGVISSISDKITIRFSGTEVSVPGQSVRNAREGETMNFRIMDVSKDHIVLKEVVKDDLPGRTGAMKATSFAGFYAVPEEKAGEKADIQAVCEAQQKAGQGIAVLTGEDYRDIESEQGTLEEYEESALDRAIEHHKEKRQWQQETMARNRESIRDFRENVERLQQQGFMDAKSPEAIEAALRDADLPVTQGNVARVASAMQMAAVFPELSEDARVYILKDQMVPTIGNLYQGQYSGAGAVSVQQLDGRVWQQVEGQVRDLLAAGGMDLDERTLEQAKWLLANDLPVTAEMMRSLQTLDDIQVNITPDKVMDQIILAMQTGALPEQAVLDDTLFLAARSVVQDLASLDSEAVRDAVRMSTDGDITLALLKQMRGQTERAPRRGIPAAGKETWTGPSSYRGSVGRGIVLAGAGDPLPEGSAYREAAGKGSVLAGVDGSPLEGPVGQEAAGKGTVLAGTEGSFYREAVGGSPVPGEEPHQGNMPSAPGMGGSLAAEDTVPAGMLPAEFTAQRQLEEIRLKMTVSSAVRMMQKGIAIEVVPLQELIEELRQQEREYYQQIAPEGKLDGKQMDLAQEALTRAEDIRRAPAYILGGIRQYNLLTMNVLHRAAVSATVQMRQYQVDYEAVGTQVREDLGDSIKKAFAGIPDLLGELGLEDTEANERAVRILGYNRMAVTEENISRVKEADAVVNSVIDHMKPSVVMELIRRGDDPLTLPLDELDAKLRTIADGQDIAPEERYSRYLWRLERENGITEQEREGYIGIYRLLHQISRSDGAVVGAVMEAGWDMTMGNLRTAARSIRQRGIDVRVNDSFGEPVSLRNEGNSVTRQTGDRSGGMDQDGQSPREQDAAEMASSHAEREDPPVQQEHMSASGQDVGSGQGQTAAGQDADPGQRRFTAGQDQASGERQPASGQEPDPRQSQAVPGQDQGSGHEQTAAGQDVVTGYYSRLAHQAWQEITPAALRQISDGDLGNVSGMSLEMFQQKLGQASGDAQVEQRLYEQLASQLRQAAEQSQEGARYLEQNGIPDTIANLQAAQRLVHGYDVFREISGMRKRLSRERPEDAGTVRKDDVEGGLLEDIFSDRLSDSLESAGSMEAEYARMEHMMEQILDRSYARSGITGEEITRLRQLGQNMALQRQMVRRYSYDIPIETEDTVTTLNVTLIQGGEDTGKVQICMEGTGTAEEGQDVPPGEEGSGRISAELRLSRGRVKGLVLCEKRACYEQLSGQRGLLEEQIEEKGFTVGNISYSLDPRSRAGAVSGARGDRVPSAQLFQLAKLAVQHVAHVLRSAA